MIPKHDRIHNNIDIMIMYFVFRKGLISFPWIFSMRRIS